MEVTTPTTTAGTGVVTFLDILGWKGIYDRNPDALTILSNLVSDLRSQATQLRGRRTVGVEIKSISDTIAMFSSCSETNAVDSLNSHGELIQWLIPRTIEDEIPIRGAVAFGEYQSKENIFVGKAVDEAASWHEQADWIGVHLTPSAEFVIGNTALESMWIKYSPPSKVSLKWEVNCVDWTVKWTNRAQEVEQMKHKFRKLGPIIPEIASKFANTLHFIETANQLHLAEGVRA